MKKVSAPIIRELYYSKEALEKFETEIYNADEREKKLFLNYPTVYIVNDKYDNKNYSVYVGETTDIRRRTFEHLSDDVKKRNDWEMLSTSDTSKMLVIGHDHFNKSLTLDIENRLMLYLTSVDGVKKVNNRRTNPQNEYYTANEFDSIFSKIWSNLRKKDKDLFPIERVIRDSAVFKASPFHKLTEEQIRAQDFILLRIMEALNRDKVGQLILVGGEAGSGKTVLMSSLFYELNQLKEDEIFYKDLSSFLLVNHDQQLTVYEQIATKLGIMKSKQKPSVVTKPTTFINNHTPDEPVDVVIVDEAHLLWTQGKQSYQGKNQLYDLLERAKVVIAVFDPNQVLSTQQYWEEEELAKLKHEALQNNNYIILSNQMRINSDKETVNWIRSIIDEQVVYDIPIDKKGYDLQIFNSPDELHQAIKEKASSQDSGISRLVATFDWEYIDKKKPKHKDEDYWRVKINNWSLPWNLQVPQTREQKIKNRNLSWAEQEQTINEVGSTFTIQGFDLNYVGVIIGPSVKYRNNRIVFDRGASKNKKATQRRKLKDQTKQYFSDMLLRNELNVLLTRGVNGLYIYAVDDELQKALINAKIGKSDLNE